MQAAYLVYVFQFNHFYSFNIWSFLDLEDVSKTVVKNVDDNFKTLSINSDFKTAKRVACFFICYNVMWKHDNEDISILKNIVFLINRDVIVLQMCEKKLKELNTCTQCFDELELFACCVIDDLVFSSLDLETCVNCQWEVHFSKCSLCKFDQHENKFSVYWVHHWCKTLHFQVLKIKVPETRLW